MALARLGMSPAPVIARYLLPADLCARDAFLDSAPRPEGMEPVSAPHAE